MFESDHCTVAAFAAVQKHSESIAVLLACSLPLLSLISVTVFLLCSFLEEERQTLTESWKKAESARKFLQSEVAALKGQREKLKEELQAVTDKMVTLRDKPLTPPDRLANY